MSRNHPSIKRSFDKKWSSWLQELHVGKVIAARPRLQIKNPLYYRHVFQNSKKKVLLDGKSPLNNNKMQINTQR